jgi:chromosome segregation ATPase
MIQSQVATARQVLAAAESRAGMSQSQLSAAQASIEEAKRTIETADSTDDSAETTLKAIEEKLLDSVTPDSELGRAEGAVEKAQEALDHERHRIVTLPEHDGKLTAADEETDRQSLSEADRNALRGDAEYQQALRELGAAKQQHARLRADFFKQDSEWVEAEKAHREAEREKAQVKQKASTAIRKAAPARSQLRNAEQVAAAARAAIAQGEARLRQLGVKSIGSASHSKPKK